MGSLKLWSRSCTCIHLHFPVLLTSTTVLSVSVPIWLHGAASICGMVSAMLGCISASGACKLQRAGVHTLYAAVSRNKSTISIEGWAYEI